MRPRPTAPSHARSRRLCRRRSRWPWSGRDLFTSEAARRDGWGAACPEGFARDPGRSSAVSIVVSDIWADLLSLVIKTPDVADRSSAGRDSFVRRLAIKTVAAHGRPPCFDALGSLARARLGSALSLLSHGHGAEQTRRSFSTDQIACALSLPLAGMEFTAGRGCRDPPCGEESDPEFSRRQNRIAAPELAMAFGARPVP